MLNLLFNYQTANCMCWTLTSILTQYSYTVISCCCEYQTRIVTEAVEQKYDWGGAGARGFEAADYPREMSA